MNCPGHRQALYEDLIYDDDSGQLLSGSLYGLHDAEGRRHSSDFDRNAADADEYQSAGRKGSGGSRKRVGATPVVISAILDALADSGVEDIALPATPQRIWEALNPGQ